MSFLAQIFGTRAARLVAEPVDVASAQSQAGSYTDSAIDALREEIVQWTHLARRATNITTTSASNASVTDLAFDIATNEVWAFEFNLRTQCSSTGGHKWGLLLPTGATVTATAHGSLASRTTIAASDITTSDGQTAVLGTGSYASDGWVRIAGVVVADSVNSGVVQLRFAAGVAGQTITVKAGSFVIARKFTS